MGRRSLPEPSRDEAGSAVSYLWPLARGRDRFAARHYTLGGERTQRGFDPSSRSLWFARKPHSVCRRLFGTELDGRLHLQATLTQQICVLLCRPPDEPDPHWSSAVPRGLDVRALAGVSANHDETTGPRHSGEFRQASEQVLIGHVMQHVPTKQARDRCGLKWNRGEGCTKHASAAIVTRRQLEHARGHVKAVGIEAPGPEVACQHSWTTSRIENGPATRALDVIGEVVQKTVLECLSLESFSHDIRVANRHSVVRLACCAKPVLVSHGNTIGTTLTSRAAPCAHTDRRRIDAVVASDLVLMFRGVRVAWLVGCSKRVSRWIWHVAR
ncbi:hypothetical protein NOZE110980_16580 [Nocardioides zeicaulis]